MVPRWRIPIVLAIVLILGAVAVPPVIEDHLEPGFCSADCPVQHAGHGTGVTTPLVAMAGHGTRVAAAPPLPRADAPPDTIASPDAPRAPPSA